LDVHLLKPARVDILPGQPNVLCSDDVHQPAWLELPQSPPDSALVAVQIGNVDR
jgi:hypothetical protein